ncbi:MAG: aldo/keto reductase, partial [Planctomycetes bacterium]|nr:aldo/keto reductase [Planctomycetota bacterium]
FDAALMERARKVVDVVSLQPPYSMVRRGIERKLLPYCIANDIGVIVYSPLQRGLLTGKITEDYVFKGDDNRANNKLYKGENLRRVNAFLDELRPIAEAHNATLAQLVINWTVHREGITIALVGARNAHQAEENAKALNFELTDEQTKLINEKLDALKLEV